MSEFLNEAELHQLTGYARSTSQASWLKEHGIAHRLVDRRVIVSHSHVKAWLEGRHISPSGLKLELVK